MVGVRDAHPPVSQSYAAFTNQGFLLREVCLVAERRVGGETKSETFREITEEDLFQLSSPQSRKTIGRAALRRVEGAPTLLLTLLAEGSFDLRRLVNLYLLLLQHRLLRDFIREVLYEAASRLSYTVSPSEVSAFMVFKVEQAEEVKRWSDSTLSKARTNLVNVCTGAGLLEPSKQGWAIVLQHVPAVLRDELKAANRQNFLPLLLDQEAL